MNDGVLKRMGAPVSAAAIALLVAGSLGTAAAASPLDGTDAHLALHYDFADAIDDSLVTDVSGGGHDGTIVGTGASIVADAIELPGDTTIEIPAEVFEGQDELTITTWLRNDMAPGNYAALYVGTNELPPSQYWIMNPANGSGRFKSAITDGLNAGAPWGTEAGISPTTASRGIDGPITGDELALYTTVITSTSITGYLDGEKIGTVETSRGIGDFGSDLIARIGTSPYSGWGDPTWDGAMADLKVFTTAFTDQQAAAQYYEELGDDAVSQSAVDADAAALSLPGTTVSDLVLPTAGTHGSEIVWSSSDEGVIGTDGTVTAAGTDTDVTLTADLALAGRTAQRDFVVTVTADPSATLLLEYDFTDGIEDGEVTDASGNGNDGTVVGDGAAVDTAAGVLSLPGGASGSDAAYVTMPGDVFEGQNTLTVSVWLRNRSGTGNYAAMFFGSPTGPPSQYWLLNPANPDGRMKSVITNGLNAGSPWTTESGISPTNAARGIAGPSTNNDWALYTTVLTPTSLTGYYNGELVGTVATSRTVTQFGTDLVAYLGRSSYADRYFEGDVRGLTVHGAAIPAQQIAADYWAGAGPEAIDAALAEDADAISLDGTTVDADITLPIEGQSGSAITWTRCASTASSTIS